MNKTVVLHSGGMDSSLCLFLAQQEFGTQHTYALSFSYGQRHEVELEAAQKICEDWGISHKTVPLTVLKEITHNALMDASLVFDQNSTPNTLVTGRNGLMVRLASIYADLIGAVSVFTGVLELEEANSGYRDCSRKYMDLMQEVMRIDLGNPNFMIRTPLVEMTKKQTLELAYEQGILDYLLENTVTCYQGLKGKGCEACPACTLKNQGIKDFYSESRG